MNVEQVSSALRSIAGESAVVTDAAKRAPFLREWRGRYEGAAPIVVRPGSATVVAAVVAQCAARGIAVVPQGGNTGLVGGSVTSPEEVLLSLSRMNRVRAVDAANFTITVDAGCTLAAAQAAAADAGLMLPLSLSAEGTCQVGGNLATNAGGVNVVRYGSARDQVLGLEVVLPDGRLFEGLHGLRKNNAGYDLTRLFVGSEGTLGVITGATLKLVAAPETRVVLWLSVADHAALLTLYARMRRLFGATIAAWELIPDIAVDFVTRHTEGTRRPADGPLHALVELHGGAAEVQPDAIMAFVGEALDAGTVNDAVVAESARDQQALCLIRHAISDAQRYEGASLKHDIALPLGALPDFVRTAGARLGDACPGVRPVCFGHIGDGNLHYNLSQPVDLPREAFDARAATLSDIVYAEVQARGGTISAEHGIGLIKRELLESQVGPVALDLMKRLKQAIDPAGLMNPGKVL